VGFRISPWRRPRIGDPAHNTRPHRGAALSARAQSRRVALPSHPLGRRPRRRARRCPRSSDRR
jgi:hypothetical protein